MKARIGDVDGELLPRQVFDCEAAGYIKSTTTLPAEEDLTSRVLGNLQVEQSGTGHTSLSLRPSKGLGPNCSSQHSGAKGMSPLATPPNISNPASTATITGPARASQAFNKADIGREHGSSTYLCMSNVQKNCSVCQCDHVDPFCAQMTEWRSQQRRNVICKSRSPLLRLKQHLESLPALLQDIIRPHIAEIFLATVTAIDDHPVS
ncbi:MAG: hypothetical protein FRX49_01907 [Trebouxia sp. A1-2]|nr:MAG: hypothetical protein FRX49_01907 [Trebouxia sp. A1-2]